MTSDKIVNDLASAVRALIQAKTYCASATGQDKIDEATNVLWSLGDKLGVDIVEEMRKHE